MNDERRTIGTTGAAGRGAKGASPSSAARSLAGPGARPKKPVTKAKPPAEATVKKAAATKAAPKKSVPPASGLAQSSGRER